MSTTTGTTASQPATKETAELIASDKVEGTAVYGRNGEKLGSVYNFMVNKRSGQVAYAVLSFGGLLGMASTYHPLPWNELTYDTSRGGYVVNRTKEQFEGAPSYSASEHPAWDDAAYRRRIDEYYTAVEGRARPI
jgi:PRC-barrel domain